MKREELTIGPNKIKAVLTSPDEPKHADTLVLVHGSWSGGWMWQMYADYLTTKGWKSCALDLRGHGQSGGTVEGATMQNYTEDIKAVVDELKIENPVLIGHSMSGLTVLLYAIQFGAKAVVSIDGSPSKEVQKENKEVKYPVAYSVMEAGMPSDPMEAMKALPDLTKEQIMMMGTMFGKESGVARSERKRGVSIPKEKLTMPVLFVGAENGKSVPFGIGSETSNAMNKYYGGEVVSIPEATHPGILVGINAMKGAEAINAWLSSKIGN